MIDGHWARLMLDDNRPRHSGSAYHSTDFVDGRRVPEDETRYRLTLTDEGRTEPHRIMIDMRDWD